MARLQILELPSGGSDERPPFLLVVDQASEDIAKALNPQDDEGAPYDAVIKRLTGLSLAEQIGARAILVFEEAVTIPANDPALNGEAEERDELHAELGLARGQLHSAALSAIRGKHANIRELIERAEQAEAERDEARQWARHGYEIGQKHCGWTDHGVAPDWLTEGWPNSFDSCEHLTKAAEYDEALTRVRAVIDDPSAIDWRQRVRAAIDARSAKP